MRWPIFRIFIGIGAVATGTTMLLDTPASSVTPAAAETGPLVEEDAAPEVAPTSVDEPLPTELQPVVIETPPEVPTAPPLFESALPIDPGPLPEGLPNLSAQGCNSCHFEVHQQWVDSPHATAWSNPNIETAFERVGDATACRSCHLPLSMQHANLAKGYHEGDPTRPELVPNHGWDPTIMTEGVTCTACHVRDGKVISTRAITDAPHPMAQSAELASSSMCATCHQLSWAESDHPIYDTYGEWSRSGYADAGVRCQDCHMPPEAGLATASRFAAMASHQLESDPGRALSVLVDLNSVVVNRGESWPLKIRVQNTGAGHAVPTGSPFKKLRLSATLIDSKGRELASPVVREYARTIQNEPPWSLISDDRILPGEESLIQGEIVVSQRKRSGPINLVIQLDKTVADEVVESTILQTIPLTLQ